MDQEPDVIRHQIEDTRSSLTDKIETLENQVLATVQNARQTVEGTIENVRETVEETIENVKSSVENTVDSVKETFDVRRQVERHPWAAVGCSFAAGFAVGTLLESRRGPLFGPSGWVDRMGEGSRYPATYREPEHRRAAEAPRQELTRQPSGPSWFDRLLTQFQPEIDRAKEMAIGALMGVARDYAKANLPMLSPQIDELMNRVTEKVGGEPVHRPMTGSQT